MDSGDLSVPVNGDDVELCPIICYFKPLESSMKSEKAIIVSDRPVAPSFPRTALGKKLLEARTRIVSSGMDLLDRKGIEKEVLNRRGGYRTESR
jgi:hypothetical protein